MHGYFKKFRNHYVQLRIIIPLVVLTLLQNSGEKKKSVLGMKIFQTDVCEMHIQFCSEKKVEILQLVTDRVPEIGFSGYPESLEK